MSRTRQRLTVEQEPFLVVRSFPAGFPSGYVIQPHSHEWSQLLYATSGVMTVHAGSAFIAAFKSTFGSTPGRL